MEKLVVALGDRAYPIYVGSSLLTSSLVSGHILAKQVMIVTNTTLAELYLEPFSASLKDAGFAVSNVILPDGEQHKSLSTMADIYDALMNKRHHRSTTVVALGGGVIGDMSGFAAATYQRGCGFIQVPTTLLAQVDSSVGGKTGVNHPQGKNMIGAFYQPSAVVIDIDTLKTLPDREISAGLAEVIKYGLIADSSFLEWLDQNIHALVGRDHSALTHAIRRSCEIKAQVVAEDETERGRRAILNLGHTFGHAIEAFQGYGKWLHGEAVGAGMSMALDISSRLGNIESQQKQRWVDLIERAGLPTEPPRGMTSDDFIELMGMDKKVRNNRIRLVVLQSVGHAFDTEDYPDKLLMDTLSAYCVS